MNKVVSLELAKLLKKNGYHNLCSNCYIWEYGDPIDSEKNKKLPQIFKGEWKIYYNFLLQYWEWNYEESCFDWVKIYYDNYHHSKDQSSEIFPFVDWNMNIFEIAQEKFLFKKVKQDDPKFWEVFQKTFRYHEWFNDCRKGLCDYEEERKSVTRELEKTETGWEQGDDWQFELYQEFISAPSYEEALDWLMNYKNLHLNIIYFDKKYKCYFSENPDIIKVSDSIEKNIEDLMSSFL